MMNRTKQLYARAGASAIAAALALSSTGVLAQDAQPAQPAPTDTAPPAATQTPAPTADVAPPAASSATASDSTEATSTPVSTRKATKVARSTTLKRTVQVAAAKPAPSTTKTVSKTTVTREPAKPASPPVTAAAAAPPAQTSQSQVTPIVDVNNAPVKTAQAKPTKKKKDDAPIIAAGSALAFLAIGGAAVGLSRRKREDEEMIEDETMIDEQGQDAEPAVRDPIFDEEPAMIAPEVSAFGWDNQPLAADRVDGRSGETWVERAYRGPSPDNPSMSLRKRLKRAAFFDKRDREVAAGEAQRVDADAGLPDALPDNGRELESA